MIERRATAPGARTVDVSRLLGLDTDGASLILGMFIVGNAVFALTTISTLTTAWPAYVAIVLVSGAGVLLVRPHPDPFPMRDTLVVVAAVVISTIVLSLALPAQGPIGRASWHLGSNMWLLWFLIIRGRALTAWMAALAMTGVTVVWAALVGRGWLTGITMVQTQLGLLCVASLFVASMRRTARRINTLTEMSVDAAAAAAAAEAGRQVRLQRAAEVADISEPLLTRITSGGELTDAERATMRDAEARLRDGVRGRALATPAVLDAAAAARGRGVDVVLLDDRGAGLPSGAAMSRVSESIVDELGETTEHMTVTVRLLPAGRDAAVTIVKIDGEKVRRTVLDTEGRRSQ